MKTVNNKNAPVPAAFIDRDGVINKDVGYPRKPSDIKLLPGVAEAVARLNSEGIPVIVITNQSGIARGYLSESMLAEIHRTLENMLAERGARLDAIYYCPHLPDGEIKQYAVECDCRKPAPGMIIKAARDWNIDLPRSFLAGDSERDIIAAKRAGCLAVLIAPKPPEETMADAVADCLAEAVDLYLKGKLKP